MSDGNSSSSQIDPRLLEILVCPVTHSNLTYDRKKQELVSKGRMATPPRPWLGLITLEHMGQLVVGGISDGGPADRAGLQRGDILHALNGDVLDDLADFYRKLWASGPAGTAVTLRMERDNDAFEVTVRTGDRGRYYKYGSD